MCRVRRCLCEMNRKIPTHHATAAFPQPIWPPEIIARAERAPWRCRWLHFVAAASAKVEWILFLVRACERRKGRERESDDERWKSTLQNRYLLTLKVGAFCWCKVIGFANASVDAHRRLRRCEPSAWLFNSACAGVRRQVKNRATLLPFCRRKLPRLQIRKEHALCSSLLDWIIKQFQSQNPRQTYD